MPNLIQLLQEYGVLIVFAIILIEQIGLPIPAFPILIVAGALVATGDMSGPLVWTVALGACMISDTLWFRAGRRYGKQILKLLCRISLSPDYCVSQTEDKFTRWGPKALIVSKFIPGFNTIAAPMAGALGTGVLRFLMFSGLGGLLWTGSGLAIGLFFHRSVDQVLSLLATTGSTALTVLGSLLLLFVLFKYVERKRFQQSVRIGRITMDQLQQLMVGGEQPVLVDARSKTAQLLQAGVPGALQFGGGAPTPAIIALDKGRHIVVYCSCPNDATAAQIATLLQTHGYHRARALSGGLDAWNAVCAMPAGADPVLP
jgi:membrane protein DedA with SNARE-associated domain/rhodanese-related sulfurtransferase